MSNKRKAADTTRVHPDVHRASLRPIPTGFQREALARIVAQELRLGAEYDVAPEGNWRRQIELGLARLEDWVAPGAGNYDEDPRDGVDWRDWITGRLDALQRTPWYAPVPWFTHVEHMTAAEVLADRAAFGASGEFMYKPFEHADAPDLCRAATHLALYQPIGRMWLQIAPAPSTVTPAAVDELIAQLEPAERAYTLAAYGQEMQRKLAEDGYEAYLDGQAAFFAQVKAAGMLATAHLEAYSLNPLNKDDMAGLDNFVRLLGRDPKQLDVLTVSCMQPNDKDNGPEQLQPVVDAWRAFCPQARLMVTSIGFTVPTGEPAGSERRARRAAAVRRLLEWAPTVGISGFGAFSFRDFDGKDGEITTDPALLEVVREFTAGPAIEDEDIVDAELGVGADLVLRDG